MRRRLSIYARGRRKDVDIRCLFYANGYTWTLFLSAIDSNLFIHRDYLAIPLQATVPTATNVYFGVPSRNYAGVQGGFNMRGP
jgi:hypothetical protein